MVKHLLWNHGLMDYLFQQFQIIFIKLTAMILPVKIIPSREFLETLKYSTEESLFILRKFELHHHHHH